MNLSLKPSIPYRLKRWTQLRTIESLLIPCFLAKEVEPLPEIYSVTTFIRNSKLNLNIVKPLTLDLVVQF